MVVVQLLLPLMVVDVWYDAVCSAQLQEMLSSRGAPPTHQNGPGLSKLL